MSIELIEKLERRRKKIELQMQKLNSELDLKEFEYIELSTQINKLKSQNLGVFSK